MTRYIYPRYHELCKSAPVLARQVLIRAYDELGSISAVARALGTTRKTVRKVLRLNLPLPRGKKEYQAFVERSPHNYALHPADRTLCRSKRVLLQSFEMAVHV